MNTFNLCFFTFLACVAYSIHFNVKGKLLVVAALGATLTYFVYDITAFLDSVPMRAFIATIVASVFAESLARILKVPATTFLIISIIPLVPGSNLYFSMEKCINNEIMEFLTSTLETFGIAGAIALGILLVSSGFRFTTVIGQLRKRRRN